MQQKPSYLQFNIDEVNDLEYCYQETLNFLLEQLPDVNWNSRLEVKDFFEGEFNLCLSSLRISELKGILADLRVSFETTPHFLEADNPEDAIEVLTLLIEYYKTKYALKNYIRCILNHECSGKVDLRDGNLMPNKQPLPYSPDIIACIEATNSQEIADYYEGIVPLI